MNEKNQKGKPNHTIDTEWTFYFNLSLITY